MKWGMPGHAIRLGRWLTPQPRCCAVSEFCERLAYYSVSTNLVQYLLDILGFDLVTANNTVCPALDCAWTPPLCMMQYLEPSAPCAA